jgi:hypothetical protein
MTKKVAVPSVLHETIAADPNLLDIIVQEHKEAEPVKEVKVQVEYQSLCCGGWATEKTRIETTVNGHLRTRPPGNNERLIITKA